MGETFLVNIDCSKIIHACEKPQYTMFVDGTKMSIVYEFVEWIRWVFSIETCFYLTHQNSVIHELEDIQLLSRLKNFRANPCEGTHCFHKKPYKTLLKHLNLFVYWNGVKVHKYFLHKVNQVDGKLLCERREANSEKFNSIFTNKESVLHFNSIETNNSNNYNVETIKSFKFENEASELPDMLLNNKDPKLKPNQESSNEMNYHFNKKQTLEKNCEDFGSSNNSNSVTNDNFNLETKQTNNSALRNYSPVKSKFKRNVETSPDTIKSHSKKYIRPFSLGEVLSKLKSEITEIKDENICTPPEIEENFYEKVTNVGNSSVTDIRTGERKRHRTRKRQKSKKEKELISPVIVNARARFSTNISNEGIFKPNHIRFDIDDENDLSEIDCQNKNKFEISDEKIRDFCAVPFSESESEKLVALTNDSHQHLSQPAEVNFKVTNTENKIEYSHTGDRETVPEQLTDFHDASAMHEKFEPDIFNPSLNALLYLKKKFKSAVVIERFY